MPDPGTTERGLLGWGRRRPAAGWGLAVVALIAGFVLGRDVRWNLSLPGLESLGGALEGLLIIGLVVLAVIIGGLLVVFRRPVAGQLLLMPALALAGSGVVGFATGPVYQAAQEFPAQVVLTLSGPETVELAAAGTCTTPENSDEVARVAAVSMGWMRGERVSISFATKTTAGAPIEIVRGQEIAPPDVSLPPYGAHADSTFDVTDRGELNRSGRLTFADLAPLAAGPAFGLGADPVLLSGQVSWSCDPGRSVDTLVASAPSGDIVLAGAVSAHLGLSGFCDEERVLLEFANPPAGKEPIGPHEGDAVSGSLFALPGAWELTVFRPGTDGDAEIVDADEFTFALGIDEAGNVIDEHVTAQFTLSYGAVSVEAAWQCAPPALDR